MKKIAIVTGATGGIGHATTKKLTENGYYVVGMSRSEAFPHDDIPKDSFLYISGSVESDSCRQKLINTIDQKFGRLDTIVNVAGVAPKIRNDILEMTEESYDYVMNINTKATMFLTQLAVRLMLKNEPVNGIRGHVVNISSISAYISSVSRGEYCISKAGVSMITKLFADRLAGEGILVNEVRPGIIATGMTAAVKEKYDRLIEGGLIPQNRWGQPEDVANAVYVLCSGILGYTTGQSLDVDGGMHIQKL